MRKVDDHLKRQQLPIVAPSLHAKEQVQHAPVVYRDGAFREELHRYLRWLLTVVSGLPLLNDLYLWDLAAFGDCVSLSGVKIGVRNVHRSVSVDRDIACNQSAGPFIQVLLVK